MTKETKRQPPPAPVPSPGSLFAAVLGWIVPGLGHWVLGYRKQAVILGVLLLGTFWWGEYVSNGYAVTRKEHPIFFYAQIGNGASTLIADRLEWGDASPPLPIQRQAGIDRKIPTLLTTGILFTSVSGLLNALLVLQLLAPRPAATPGGGTRDGGAKDEGAGSRSPP